LQITSVGAKNHLEPVLCQIKKTLKNHPQDVARSMWKHNSHPMQQLRTRRKGCQISNVLQLSKQAVITEAKHKLSWFGVSISTPSGLHLCCFKSSQSTWEAASDLMCWQGPGF